jgi:radical SAM protein with 4Fe4S-binding SPASM domain
VKLLGPDRLTLQWHVTNRCGQACGHCYHEPSDELPAAARRGLLAQFERLLEQLGARRGAAVRGRVHLTGGEPFLAVGFLDLIEAIRASRMRLEFAVMTTGLPVDRELARTLVGLGPVFVQVSLDGDEEAHDRLRGPGNWRQVVAAISRMAAAGLFVSVSFTALASTAHLFPAVVAAARRAGAKAVWSDRLVPLGRAAALRGELLAPAAVERYVRLVGATAAREERRLFGRTRVGTRRALQFWGSSKRPYACSAGQSLLALLPDGVVVPCRRLPIRVGTLPADDLAALYFESPLLAALRDPRRVVAGCARCAYQPLCQGGLRCLAHAVTGDPFTADPGCALAERADGGGTAGAGEE